MSLRSASAKPAARAERGTASLYVGGSIVLLVVLTALVSFVWTPHNPTLVKIEMALQSPGSGHLLGTDPLGRDVLSILMAGAQTALTVGILAVLLSFACGIPLGLIAALRGGIVGDTMMRVSDIVYSFPAVLLAIFITAATGPGKSAAIIAVSIANVPVIIRVTRSAALPVLQRDFILAARTYGQSDLKIAVRHVMPNILAYLLVQASVLFCLAILVEAALSYLGLGTQPPEPSWGRSLQEAQVYLASHPSLAVWPGLCIAISVLGFNLLGDGLRDRWDPRTRERT